MHTGDELEILSQGFDQMAGAVQDKVEALELSVQQRDDFVGAFTHELKTPMTGIIGYADLLRSIQPDPEEQREAAGAIFHEAQRLEALSGKLLQLMGLGEHAPQLVPVQLDSVFAEARRAVAPALNGCILTMQSNGLTVQGDADLLCDLVINLVTNAAKASTPGSAIAVCAEQADGSIRLTVQDHGQGIPADKLARVWSRFYMVDKSRSRRQGGSGLGLALCSRIAQAHGGTLAMESELGKGTTVTITLPAPNQTAAELAQEEPRMKNHKRGKLLMLACAAWWLCWPACRCYGSAHRMPVCSAPSIKALACMNPARSAGMIFIYYSRSKTAPR